MKETPIIPLPPANSFVRFREWIVRSERRARRSITASHPKYAKCKHEGWNYWRGYRAAMAEVRKRL